MSTTYSHSRLKTFTDCPKQYAYRYVERVKVRHRQTPDTHLGNALHRVLKSLYEHGASGVILTLDDAIAAYDANWNSIDLSRMVVHSEYETVDDYIRQGREMLTHHWERYHPFNKGTLLSAEKMFTFDLPGSSFRFQARIDKLWKRDDGVIEICDYKTSKSLARSEDPMFLAQMGLYQIAVQVSYPNWDNIEVAQLFLRHDEILTHRMGQDQLDLIADQLRSTVYAIQDAIRLGDLPAREGVHCRWCDYFDICPAKRHARQLEMEEGPDYNDAVHLRDLADRFLQKNYDLQALRAEVDALKAELREAAKSTSLDRLEGETGEVTVRIRTEEKFLTKTADPQGWSDLNRLVREIGLDDYLVVDASALMREIYLKRRLPEDQLKRLSEFVRVVETAVVRGKVFSNSDLDEA